MLEGLQDLVGLGLVGFFPPKLLQIIPSSSFCCLFFFLMPCSTGMKGTENLPSVYIEWSFQMHCLSFFFRVPEYMLWLVQMYNTNLSFLLRGGSYFIADAYCFYCFCHSVKHIFTIVDFSLSFFSFILYLFFV